jgi:two-component system cell cycle sensor histidine kinase/response regulator CckA
MSDGLPRAEASGATIVLAEDDALLGSLLSRSLEQQGYTVLWYRSAREAIDGLRRDGTRVRLVVTDVSMGDMSGTAIADAARASGRTVPVLFISGHSEDTLVRRGALPGGGAPYLQKPFTLEEFGATVRDLLGGA